MGPMQACGIIFHKIDGDMEISMIELVDYTLNPGECRSAMPRRPGPRGDHKDWPSGANHS